MMMFLLEERTRLTHVLRLSHVPIYGFDFE